MKKLIITLLICAAAVTFYRTNCGQAVKDKAANCEIYYVDRRLHRLIPLDFDTGTDNVQKSAERVIAQIIDGMDENKEILRTIPKIKNGLSVKVKNNTATVDISENVAESHEKSPDNERLSIYQIVNSLTSVDGIDEVRFTVDSKNEKDFVGFVDIDKNFVPNYDL